MIDNVQIEDCCLCQACSSICPVNAIHFVKEYKNFKYPVIEKERCIRCEKCAAVCPAKMDLPERANEYPKAYAARSRSIEVRKKSSSGGFFYEASSYILEKNGYVCGAVKNSEHTIYHTLSNDLDIVKAMCGSKYAQSDMSKAYGSIKEKLDQNQTVFFCGCPCQTAALKQYLKKEYENLITADFICHGIPSNDTLKQYLKYLEKKYNSKIRNWSMRDKTNGWHQSSVRIEFENGKEYIEPITVDVYMKSFLSGVTMKESCYCCRYKFPNGCSDITMGDFWGAEVVFPHLDDNTGLSAIVVNSKKGLELLSALPIEYVPADLESVIKYNKNLIEPTKRNPLRTVFYEYSASYGIEMAMKKFFEEKRIQRVYRKLRYAVRCMYYKLRGRGKPLY